MKNFSKIVFLSLILSAFFVTLPAYALFDVEDREERNFAAVDPERHIGSVAAAPTGKVVTVPETTGALTSSKLQDIQNIKAAAQARVEHEGAIYGEYMQHGRKKIGGGAVSGGGGSGGGGFGNLFGGIGGDLSRQLGNIASGNITLSGSLAALGRNSRNAAGLLATFSPANNRSTITNLARFGTLAGAGGRAFAVDANGRSPLGNLGRGLSASGSRFLDGTSNAGIRNMGIFRPSEAQRAAGRGSLLGGERGTANDNVLRRQQADRAAAKGIAQNPGLF